jgi:hypothetical protein
MGFMEFLLYSRQIFFMLAQGWILSLAVAAHPDESFSLLSAGISGAVAPELGAHP